MSGWTDIIVGNVELEHYSTSSIIRVVVRGDEMQELFLDYEGFASLKSAIDTVSFPSKSIPSFEEQLESQGLTYLGNGIIEMPNNPNLPKFETPPIPPKKK